MIAPLLNLVLPIGAQHALIAIFCFAFTGTASTTPIPKNEKGYAGKKDYAGKEQNNNLMMH
jgi:hypothetical protein